MRGRNQSITLLTGASEDGLPEHDWKALAKPGQTIAIYMGVRFRRRTSQARLLNAGIDAATPVTIVENGTLAGERVFETRIDDLVGDGALKRRRRTGHHLCRARRAKTQSTGRFPFRAPTARGRVMTQPRRARS